MTRPISQHLRISVSDETNLSVKHRNIHYPIQSQGRKDVPATAHLPIEQKFAIYKQL